MSFFSLYFLVGLAATVLVFSACRTALSRRIVLTVVNIVFVATLIDSTLDAIGLILFIVLSYGILVVIQRYRSRFWLPLGIVTAVVTLVVLKRYYVLNAVLPEVISLHPVVIVGLSYMTFKLIHMMVDGRQRQLERVTFWQYISYQLGWYCIVAGPIQRYNEVATWWQRMGEDPSNDWADLRAWNRMLTGMIKLGVVGALLFYAYSKAHEGLIAADSSRWGTIGLFAVVFYGYPAYIYFNFSGYCDIVIGGAALLGLRQPENFRRPYLARNVLDFWNRWHITLTHWIRDYVFTPTYKWVAQHWSRHAGIIGYGLMFLALLTAGMWHGPTRNFIVFGAIHGMGVVVAQAYGDTLKRLLGRKRFKEYLANPWYRMAAMGITFNYVCFSFLFFRPGIRDSARLVRDVVVRLMA